MFTAQLQRFYSAGDRNEPPNSDSDGSILESELLEEEHVLDEDKPQENGQQKRRAWEWGDEKDAASEYQEPERKKHEYSARKLEELKFNVWPYEIQRNWWKGGKRMTFWANWRQAEDVLHREAHAKWAPERLRWKVMKNNNILPRAIIAEFQEKMDKMPKEAHPRYCQNLCMFTGRRRGKFNRFRVNRHIFRQLADEGKLSGVQRALW